MESLLKTGDEMEHTNELGNTQFAVLHGNMSTDNGFGDEESDTETCISADT